jgi:hypothetical protein
LVVEEHDGEKKEISCIGGKREADDRGGALEFDPWITACREFAEETGLTH